MYIIYTSKTEVISISCVKSLCTTVSLLAVAPYLQMTHVTIGLSLGLHTVAVLPVCTAQ